MASTDVVNLILHHARKGVMLVNNIAAVKGCGGFKETRMYAPGTLVSLRAKLLFGYPFFIALFFANAHTGDR